MKKIMLAIALLFSGCSTVTVKTPECEFTYTRIFTELDGFTAEICGGKTSVNKTGNNADALVQLLKAAVK